jgi:hypothetical protein
MEVREKPELRHFVENGLEETKVATTPYKVQRMDLEILNERKRQLVD